MPVDIKVNTTATVPRRGLRFDTTKALPRTRLPAFDFRAPKRTSTTGPPERRKPEDDAIALFIAEKGVSKCPDAMPGAGDLGELEFDQQTRKWRRNPPPVDTSPAQVD